MYQHLHTHTRKQPNKPEILTLHLQCYGPHVYTLQVVTMHPELSHKALLAPWASNQPLRWCLTKPPLTLFMRSTSQRSLSLLHYECVQSSYDTWTFHCQYHVLPVDAFFVLANQNASIQKAQLGTCPNTDWLIQPQSPWWPSSTNA